MLYIPKINQNLVSVGQLIESGYSIFFNDGVYDIKDKKGVLLLSAKMMNRSFNVDLKKVCFFLEKTITNCVLNSSPWGFCTMLKPNRCNSTVDLTRNVGKGLKCFNLVLIWNYDTKI